MNIVFLGIGKMGLPLARHLHEAGFSLTAHDPDPTRLSQATQAGLTISEDIDIALAHADVIISSLPDDNALRTVATQLCHTAPRHAIWVDTSTVSITASAEVAAICAHQALRYLRVTVSGNNHMAEAAQLTMLASGPADTYTAVLPLLTCWGPHRFYLGDAEQARLMKLVLNLMIAQTSAMLAESLTLGRKGGLDWEAMWEVINASALASPIVKAKSAQLARPVTHRDFSPTFTAHQMIKDVDLILAAGHTLNVPLAQIATTKQWLLSAVAHGDGDEDYATIIKAVEQASGLGQN